MSVSPLLKNADDAVAFFDRRLGQWRTKIVHGGGRLVTLCSHRSEAEARAWIGLDGGSKDPEYTPPNGQNNLVTA